ncbi:phosphonate C-P lyase system protein PhnH [Achromobacter aloeverae]|uniref:Phosphonate C-P lyase system protein PhnH n=1 Tax=Achromobacter aloeverae TaxID=1750518 RepID=A0A4Q1HCS5_9BURK|nr:phosphonate C-P lyase system protein PhnH [Achromobacter aloeverae]RXN83404.1 phosphonate C-P lyase system protein PhnH [Achromobacter aloeverae]
MTQVQRAATAPTINLLPGFADPVAQAQAVFRVALQALSEPGQPRVLAAECGVPAGLSPALAALLLTLADVDTPVWLPAGLDDAVAAFLRFHCGCPLVATPAEAVFVVAPAGHAAPALADCNAGDPAYPDRSTTLLIEVEDWQAGTAVRLTGPGIADARALAPAGLPADFWRQWAVNHRRFPQGVDVLLTHGREICGLPRTTRVEA